ncbi:MAG: ribonuclease III [Anaerolineaceae bacterium]|nr:ribonuclease III [Anaerolineaceae bacterium]
MDLQEFQTRHGLRFRDTALLQQALTHRSFLNEQEDVDLPDNERLEFLGDAVLDFVITRVLFARYPRMPEGDLTRLRAALVRTDTLADVAAELQIGEVLRMGRGEELTGGRQRRNLLCDAFEALLGALYLDQGLEPAADFVMPLLMPLVEYILAEGLHIDARSKLQEWSQAVLGETPVYEVVAEDGPDHEKEFTVRILIGDHTICEGQGRSKQLAAQAAARAALKLQEAGELSVPLS